MVKRGIQQEPKGVSMKRCYDIYVDYRDTDVTNSGVRKKNHVYYFRSKQHSRIPNWSQGLRFDRLCLCGSLHHATTRHSDCLLNVRYMDA